MFGREKGAAGAFFLGLEAGVDLEQAPDIPIS